MSLFPMIDTPDSGEVVETQELPLYTEAAWNFDTNTPVWRGGNPVLVTGADAVLVWAWNALHTERFAHDIFSADYGQDLSELIGRGYTDEVKHQEAIRCIREALTINPYITDVTQVNVGFQGSTLLLACKIKTIYGEVQLNDVSISSVSA